MHCATAKPTASNNTPETLHLRPQNLLENLRRGEDTDLL